MATRKKSSRRKGGRAAPASRSKARSTRPQGKSPRRSRKGKLGEEALRAYVRAHAEGFLMDENITSVGIGYKSVGGKPTDQISIQFTVRKKEAESRLEDLGSTPIPKTVTVSGVQVPTDVLERDYEPSFELLELVAKDKRKTRLDTLVPGISVSHPKGTAGTLGLVVFDGKDGTPCMLSNWHVLNTPKGALGDPVVQPGPYDDDRVSLNRAGTLVRSHLGMAGDCAIARIESRRLDPAVLDLAVVPSRVARPHLGDRVVKSGRTTAVTHGIVTRIDTTTKIDYGAPVGEALIGGFEIGPNPAHPAPANEISMGGDSGSAWLVADGKGKPTDIFVGLHFAGETAQNPAEYALACYAHAVLEKLEITLAPLGKATAAAQDTVRGYDSTFLGSNVPLPDLSEAQKRDAVRLGKAHVIPYTHFSLGLSKSRRMARFVAWNIDGERLRKDGRKGLAFRLDPRIPGSYQTGEDVYADNKLDRGHLARRADLVWGPAAEARQANEDSFFFTNITPQHQAFNQSMRRGLWGMLEDAIFEDFQVGRLRVSVLGGPLFKKSDIEYRGSRVPSDFWKVLLFVDEEDEKLKAKAYVLTQRNLLDDLEAFELDDFRLYQVSVKELERLSGLRFGKLRDVDDFETGRVAEAVSERLGSRPVREVTSRAELVR